MNIHRINDHLFAVDSETRARSYTVNLAGQGSCSCPHATYRSAVCKHQIAVRDYLAGRTSLARAAAKAAGLTDEQLRMWAAQYDSGPVAGACRLELAARKLRGEQPEPKPIPAGIMELLEGATEAERERALASYR